MSEQTDGSAGRKLAPGPQELADQLWGQILDEGLGPGDRFGAERELSTRFGVSRWVIRKALEELEARGLVVRTNGRSGGVFVAHERVVRDLRSLVGIPAYLRAQGIEAGTRVVGTSTVPAENDIAKQLEVTPGSWLIRLDRLRFAASLPFSIEAIWLPADMFPGLLDHSLVGSLYELLEAEYGIERGEALETISARVADKEAAAALQMSVGAPLLAVSRTARLVSGQPFEHGEELYRAERVEILVKASPDQTATRRVTEGRVK